MVELEPVILVRELPPARSRLRQHLPSIRELVSPGARSDEGVTLAYLAQGAVCGVYNDRGLLFDVLEAGKRIDVASREDPRLQLLNVRPALILTDGVWVWPGVLTYYLAVYHLRLPERFSRQAEERGWRIDAGAIDAAGVSWDAYDAVN